MPASLKNKKDIKIFILYLLRNVGYPLSYVRLHDICVYDGIVSSFDFTECLDELVDADNVLRTFEGEEELYSITDQGVRVSRALSSDILRSVRETGKRTAMRMLDFAADGTVFKSDTGEEDKDGSCEFSCGIIRGDTTLLELRMTAASKNEAKFMKSAFDSDPEGVLKSVYELLTSADRINYRGQDPDKETFKA